MRKEWLKMLILLVILVLFWACGSKTPLPENQKHFAGQWVAADGTYVQIFLDGSGNLKTANTEVTGGSTTIAEGKLTIKMFGIGSEFTITREPQEINGKWVMVLDGIEYVKQ